jgi:drug/metabolite transporter (DMT)-like permease
MPNILNYIQFILLSAIWGASFLFLRITAPVLGPFVVTDARVFLGMLLLGTYVLCSKHKIFGDYPWGKLLLIACLSCAVPFTLIAFSEIYLSTSMGSILNATTPIYAALLSLMILKEKSHYSQYIGFLLGIFGVVILVGLAPILTGAMTKWALAAILLATFFYATGGLYAAKNFNQFPPVILVFWQQVFSFVLLFPFAYLQRPHLLPHKDILISITCLGVFCTGLAFLLYFQLIKHIGAGKTLSVAYLIPVFGILWGHLFLNEKIGESTIFGTLTILFGIYLIYRKPKSQALPIPPSVLESDHA